MKMINFLMISLLIFSNTAVAGECPACVRATALIAEIEDSQIKPEALNQQTIKAQNKFISEASDLTAKILALRSFKAEQAETLILLNIKILPYDVPMTVPEKNMSEFQRVFKSNKILSQTLDKLVKDGKIKELNKKQLLAYMGVIPATGLLDHLQ